MAYTIHEAHRGKGMGTLLQEHLENYAERMGFAGATAYLFEGNRAMLRTFAKRGPYEREPVDGGVMRIVRWFGKTPKA